MSIFDLFTQAHLASAASLDGADLSGANLSGANLVDVVTDAVLELVGADVPEEDVRELLRVIGAAVERAYCRGALEERARDA